MIWLLVLAVCEASLSLFLFSNDANDNFFIVKLKSISTGEKWDNKRVRCN